MIFDRRLTYKEHIDYVSVKTIKRINLLKVVSGTYWGASKQSLLNLYRALIRSVLDYGCQAYGFASKSNLEKLSIIQNQALRVCCGAMGSTPICALQASCNEMPLHLRRTRLCLSYRSHLERSLASHPSKIIIQDSWHELYCLTKPNVITFNLLTKSFHLTDQPCQPIMYLPTPPWLLPTPTVDLELLQHITKLDHPGNILSISREFVSELYRDYVTIYTDGSKTSTGAGVGVFIPSVQISISRKCSHHLSSFTLELLAILHGLEWVLKNGSSRKYVLLSDCASALQSLNASRAFKPMNNLFLNIFSLFEQIISTGIDIALIWIPGHMGIDGNERADKLARAAACGHEGNEDPVEMSLLEAKSRIRNHCQDRWEQEYTLSEKGQHYKLFQNSVYNYLPPAKNRTQETTLFRLRTGHCKLNAHLFKIGCVNSPNCEICSCPETVAHFLLKCPRYAVNRSALFGSPDLSGIRPTLHDLLTIPEMIPHVIDFAVLSKKYL